MQVILKEDAIEYLKQYSWPGNIRELRQVAQHLLLNPSGIIHVNDVKKIINHKSIFVDQDLNNEKELSHAHKSFIWKHGLRNYIAKIEKEMVAESLNKNNGKISLAIKDLKISSSAFYRILGQ